MFREKKKHHVMTPDVPTNVILFPLLLFFVFNFRCFA